MWMFNTNALWDLCGRAKGSILPLLEICQNRKILCVRTRLQSDDCVLATLENLLR